MWKSLSTRILRFLNLWVAVAFTVTSTDLPTLKSNQLLAPSSAIQVSTHYWPSQNQGVNEIPQFDKETEIACSGPGLGKEYVGNGQALMKKLEEVYSLPDPKEELETRIKRNGMEFLKRKSGPNLVWIYKKEDRKKVEESCDFKLRNENLEDFNEETEIACSRPGLRKEYGGDGQALMKKLEEVYSLPDPKEELETRILRNGMEFLKRKSGTHLVWVYKKENRKKVEERCGLKLKNLKIKNENLEEFNEDTEIACSGQGFHKEYMGRGQDLVKKFRNVYMLPDPKEEVETNITRNGMEFFKRKHIIQIIWVYKKTDRKKVEASCDFKLRNKNIEEIDEKTEITCTVKGLKEYFGSGYFYMKKLQKTYDLPDPKEVVETSIQRKGVEFFKRKKGTAIVWVYKKADRTQVEISCGFRLRNLEVNFENVQDYNEETEIAVSINWLEKEYVANGKRLIKSFQKEFSLPDPDEGLENVIHRNGVEFYKRKSNNKRLVWVYKKADRKVVEDRLGLKLKNLKFNNENIEDFNEESEISCSGLGLRAEYMGRTTALSKKLQNVYKLPDPKDEPQAKIERQGIVFFKRKCGTVLMWVFKKTDRKIVEKSCGFKLKIENLEEFNEQTEIACSVKGLRREYVGNSQALMKIFNNIYSLPDPKETIENSVQRNGIQFIKRKNGTIPVWVYKKENRKRVEGACGFARRDDIEKKIAELWLFGSVASTAVEKNLDETLKLKRIGEAPIHLSDFPQDDKIYAVPAYSNSNARLSDIKIWGIPTIKLESKQANKDVLIVIRNRKVFLILEGEPEAGKNFHDYKIIDQSQESKEEDSAFKAEIESTLDEIFDQDVFFFATRYNMDIRAILWGLIGHKLKGKYDRKKIEELIDEAVLKIIEDNITEETPHPKEKILNPIPTPQEESKPEPPKPFDSTDVQLGDIADVANRLDRKIKEKIKNEGLQAMLQGQVVNFIRKLEEQYFFKKFYRQEPDKALIDIISEGLSQDFDEIKESPLALQALRLIQDNIAAALALNEELYECGLKKTTALNLYQLIGIMKMRKRKKVILADEMGLGKTLETLATFLSSDAREMIVVAPKTALGRWVDDLKKHTDMKIKLAVLGNDIPTEELEKESRFKVTKYTKPNKRFEFLFGDRAPPKGDAKRIILISYGIMPRLSKYREKNKLAPVKTQFLALDEAHALKNRDSIQSQTIFGDSDGVGAFEAEYKILITGTPLENQIQDLFSYLKYLALSSLPRGEREATDDEDKAEKMIRELNLHDLISIFRETNLAHLSLFNNYLIQRMIRRLKQDVVTGLPQKCPLLVRLNPLNGEMKILKSPENALLETRRLSGNYHDQLNFYETALSKPADFEREMVQKLPPLEEDDEEEIPQNNAGVRQILRLEQAALDPGIFGETADSIKFDAALELIRERIAQGKSVLIFTNFKTVSRRLRDYLKEKGIDSIAYVDGGVVGQERKNVIDVFQSAKSKVMIATTGTMGVSVELTQADTVLFMNYPWKPSTFNQAVDRAHRLDKTRNRPGKVLEIISLELEHNVSIDALKRQTLRRKEILQEMIVEGNLSPEVLAAFTESDEKIMEVIHARAADEVKLDDYEISLLQQFRLRLGQILQNNDPKLWDEVSRLYREILEHKGSYFANMASLDYLSGDMFPELKDRRLEVLDLASGPSTLYRAWLKKRGIFEARNFELHITDYDRSGGMLRLGEARPGDQIQGAFESLHEMPSTQYNMVNLSFAFRYASHPADTISQIHRMLKPSGLFVMILPRNGVIPPRFFEALREAGFRLKTGSGAKLQSKLDPETYKRLAKEYGKEFADDIAAHASATFTYLIAEKAEEISQRELHDEDFRIGVMLNPVGPEKVGHLIQSSGKTMLIPEEGTVEGEVIYFHDFLKMKEVVVSTKEEATGEDAEVGKVRASTKNHYYRRMTTLVSRIARNTQAYGMMDKSNRVDRNNLKNRIEKDIKSLRQKLPEAKNHLSEEEKTRLSEKIKSLTTSEFSRQWFKRYKKDKIGPLVNILITELQPFDIAL